MTPPYAKLTRLTDAAIEPLTLAQAKKYLRLEIDDDDELVADLITAARLACEVACDRSFVTTTWGLTLDYLPLGTVGGVLGPAIFGFQDGRRFDNFGVVQLPMPPLIALESIDYTDMGGIVRSIDVSPESTEVIVSPGTPGRITAGFGTFWPFSRPTIASVDVVYTAGYGDTADSVPKNVAVAMRLLVSHYYEHRSSDAPIPQAVANLLAPSQWGSYV